MEILLMVVEYSLCAATSNYNMLNVSLQSFQGQKKRKFHMGKHLPKTKKLPYETIYQKFHSRIHVLGISLLPSTH
jgi:hypothetical protein